MHELDVRLKPLHVVNLTLNLVEANRLAWQQRKAQPFTVTPLHCGNFELGYRRSSHYGGPDGISLGTAAAISGAAASPNMGYRSSPAAGFIMTLLNARLGAWLGNPGPAGARTWKHAGPRSAIRSLVNEAFGLTSNQNEYVYLSDGGHFENLGLYEMVLRRCHGIVVLDSGCDPDFSYDDLGNALRKIRIDLRIPITFDDAAMQPLRGRRLRCSMATIRYGAVDEGAKDGWLIYVKPMCLGNEPPDVANYGRSNPEFPHQSTNNQWFDETQTESYRMLGAHEHRGNLPWLGRRVPGRTSPPRGARLSENRKCGQSGYPMNLNQPNDAASSAAPPSGSFNVADMDPGGLKGRFAAWLFDEPQWWMGLLRKHCPVARFPGGWTMVTRFEHVQEVLSQEKVFNVPFGERMMEMTAGPNFVLGMQDGPLYQLNHAQILQALQARGRARNRRAPVDQIRRGDRRGLRGKAGRHRGTDHANPDAAVRELLRRPDCGQAPLRPMDDCDEWLHVRASRESGPRMPVHGGCCGELHSSGDRQRHPRRKGGSQPAGHRSRAVCRDAGTGSRRPHRRSYPRPVVRHDHRLRPDQHNCGRQRARDAAAPARFHGARAAALADEDDLLRRCLFEAMRYMPINPGPFRVCSEDYTIAKGTPGATTIRAGTKLLVSTQSAMFDERKVEKPTEFNPERARTDYMLFGHGLHWCIGAYIAEAQITQTFKPLLKRNGLRRAGGAAGQMHRLSVFPVHLVVEFDR